MRGEGKGRESRGTEGRGEEREEEWERQEGRWGWRSGPRGHRRPHSIIASIRHFD